jgi:hypothetical protein
MLQWGKSSLRQIRRNCQSKPGIHYQIFVKLMKVEKLVLVTPGVYGVLLLLPGEDCV